MIQIRKIGRQRRSRRSQVSARMELTLITTPDAASETNGGRTASLEQTRNETAGGADGLLVIERGMGSTC